MFILITGKPRSGKSAYAVDHMLKKKKDYFNIYANVNGLKMHDNIKPLNFNRLLETVGRCKEIYDVQIASLGNDDSNVNTIDEPIIEFLLEDGFIEINPKYQIYLDAVEKRKNEDKFFKFILNNIKPIERESKYKPTLIIIDEAQNHLPSKDKDTGKVAGVDPIISWWISYHGHLYMDVFLLSQNYHKIHPAYIYDIEYFLDAMPSSKMIFGSKSPNFIYKHHIGTPFNSKNLAGKKKIRKRKEIFEAYESGDQVRTKSVVLPLLFLSLGFLFIVVIIIKTLISSLSPEPPKESTTLATTSKVLNSNTTPKNRVSSKPKNTDFNDLSYVKFDCYSDVCTSKEYKINFNLENLNKIVLNTDSQILSTKLHSDVFLSLQIMVTKDFINLFQGAKNEKNKLSGDINFLN